MRRSDHGCLVSKAGGAIREVNGFAHTLNARANLASSYRATGDLDRAIELHERNVADYARVFGDDGSAASKKSRRAIA